MKTHYHYLFLTLVAAGMMGMALYFQYGLGLEPCPLCILQRIAVIGIGLSAFIAFLINPSRIGQKIASFFIFSFAVFGAVVAARHVWLQHLPEDQVPACGPGLDYWLETLPLSTVLGKIFAGSGECAKIDWSFLGLSMPELTLPAFILLAIYAIWLFFKSNKDY